MIEASMEHLIWTFTRTFESSLECSRWTLFFIFRNSTLNVRSIFGTFDVDPFFVFRNSTPNFRSIYGTFDVDPFSLFKTVHWTFDSAWKSILTYYPPHSALSHSNPHLFKPIPCLSDFSTPPCILPTLFLEWERDPRERRGDLGVV
jgi:hypothetical protein